LPSIYYSILANNTDNIEWIVIYDSDKIDTRILQYEENVSIKLFNVKSQQRDSTASRQRNLGIKHSSGEYLYFLDDDNLIGSNFYEKIKSHAESDKLLIFNRFTETKGRSIVNFDWKHNKPGYIDTSQIVVPSSCKSRWDNSVLYMDEFPYIKKLVKELGEKNIKFVDRLYTYRNYLSRFKI
jgi:glycosyltransferase involved in cell wall biosynthesis